ncbi:MAG: hypothetical protein IPK60_24860 [Sandaracinaceae bacterium]|jgi:hypothetical protein|nr:hypothetical protein [Sandaracinaceae bacterium]
MKAIALSVSLMLASLSFVGCHADPDDPAGQAKELANPVRRQNAIGNLTRLYTSALAAHNGNRQDPAVKGIADAIIDSLIKTYTDFPEDNRTRRDILSLMREMRDVRSLPVLVKALEWRAEINEDQAIAAAQTLKNLTLDPAQTTQVVTALGVALDKVEGRRPTDAQMRTEFMSALGATKSHAAVAPLMRLALRLNEDQDFAFNVRAFQVLAPLTTAEDIPNLIKGLFLFAPGRPQFRVNDSAQIGLVGVGPAALQPLLDVLAGRNADANAMAASYIEAMRTAAPAYVETHTAALVVAEEATTVLGELGLSQAIQPLVSRLQTLTGEDHSGERLSIARALARIHRSPADTATVREAIISVYRASQKVERPFIVATLQHTFDADALPFLLEVARTPEDEVPVVRGLALHGYALLANGSEAAAARALIANEPGPADGGFHTEFEADNAPLLVAAGQCNVDIACWVGKLSDSNREVALKATYMLARLGRGNAAALNGLIAKIDFPNADVRVDVMAAIDFLADRGSPEAVARIETLQQTEDGRSIWNAVKPTALATAARLRARSAH